MIFKNNTIGEDQSINDKPNEKHTDVRKILEELKKCIAQLNDSLSNGVLIVTSVKSFNSFTPDPPAPIPDAAPGV